MSVTVELDEGVAAHLLAFLTAVAQWGDEWEPVAGRSLGAIEPLRAVLTIDVARDAYVRVADGAAEVAAGQ